MAQRTCTHSQFHILELRALLGMTGHNKLNGALLYTEWRELVGFSKLKNWN